MDSSADFSNTYDIFTSSDDYARRFSGRVGEWFLKVQERATLDMLASYPNATVLDVGGGHGQTIDALVRNGYKVTVLGSAEVCKARIQPYLDAGQARFDVGDILHMPYPDKSFDVVMSFRFVAHVTECREFLAEMARVAKRAVIIDYPEARSANSIGPYLFRWKKQLEGNTREYTQYRGADLARTFEQSGFHPSARYPQFLLPMVLHRILKQPRLSAGLESAFRLSGLTSLFGSPVILKVERRG